MNFIKNMIELFRDDESGAVTIEYVGLALLVGGLGTAAYNVLDTALTSTGATITF